MRMQQKLIGVFPARWHPGATTNHVRVRWRATLYF